MLRLRKQLRCLYRPALILFLTSSCTAPTTALTQVSDFCSIVKPITFDGKLDTPETQKQIMSLDAQYMCICLHQCPKGATS